ncbi:MAG: hypothetical protein LBC98_09505 [Prevotellaceae bacterium]|jgi:hypothetical protein|nr:hypothetical protein [Prevotellaceae bacterium]
MQIFFVRDTEQLSLKNKFSLTSDGSSDVDFSLIPTPQNLLSASKK